MPKGKRRAKQDKRRPELVPSDDDSLNDNGSVTSSVSEVRSVFEDGGGGGGGGVLGDVESEDNQEQDTFEEKLKEDIDGATQKSAKGRQACLEALAKAFTSRYVYDFILERRVTLTDCIERSLRKGKGDEQGAAAMLAILLGIQLGAGTESEEVFRSLKQVLLHVASDTSATLKARAKCYTALGFCSFIAGADDSIHEVMQALEAAFSASYLKGNGAVPNHSPELTALHSNSISAWSLLLTLLSPQRLQTMVESHLYRLPELLESSDVDVRITAGDAIAIFYEVIRESDDSFEGDDIDELCDKLKQLATDSHKYRAKKERKQQRSSFREILKAVENRETPNTQVKFGREVLELDSWCRKRQYDAFCQILGSGMNLHLRENYLLREIFGLGDPIPANGVAAYKISKLERHMVNMAAFKARTIARSKVRDKRAVVI